MQKKLHIEKIIFKVVKMKFLAMHINNQKLCFDIFTKLYNLYYITIKNNLTKIYII